MRGLFPRMSVNRLLLWSATGLPERLASALEAEGYTTEAVADADAFRSRARSGRYALGFLHCSWPSGARTLDALRDLRRHSGMPCAVVAASPLPPCERVAALDAGADEIIDATMPVPEAVARVRAVLRRAGRPATDAPATDAAAPPLPARGGWRLSPGIRRMQTPDGDSHRLTAAEFDLLRLLVAASGETVHRDAISRQALRRPWQPDDRAVDGLVKRLRRKLGPDAIQTSRGVGYALTIEVHSR